MDRLFAQVSGLVLALASAGCILDTYGVSGSDSDSVGVSTGHATMSTGQATSIQPTTSGSTSTDGSSGVSTQCGDGVVDLDEACDDGDQDNLDGCKSDCTPTQGIAVFSGPYAYHTCVLLYSGEQARCWGANRFGQLGYNFFDMTPGEADAAFGDSPDESLKSNAVDFHVAVAEVASTFEYTCMRTTSGSVYCWGAKDWCTLQGSEPPYRERAKWHPDSSEDNRINLSGKARQIATGTTAACAVLEDGKLSCWGKNNYGEVGTGTKTCVGNMDSPVEPVEVNVGPGVKVDRVAMGHAHTCVLTQANNVKCWGQNASGELGNGQVKDYGVGGDPQPVDPSTAADVVLNASAMQVAACFQHTCVILDGKADGPDKVRCWGANEFGQLGQNSNSVEPVIITSDPGMDVDLGLDPTTMKARSAKNIGCGRYHTCALTDDGDVFCWGFKAYGQLGYGEIMNNVGDGVGPSPGEMGSVPLGESAEMIAVGADHSCALMQSGSLSCWGRSDVGQMGLGCTPKDAMDVKCNMVAPASIPYF